MREYVFVDGPLTGQTLALDGPVVEGEAIIVEVVDVGQDPHDVPLFEYVVEAPPTPYGAPQLRYVASTPPGQAGAA